LKCKIMYNCKQFGFHPIGRSDMINPIAALSPLDGRYAKSVEALRPIFSEYGLMRARVKVELNWLKVLAAEPKIVEVPAFSDFTLAEIDKVIENFSLEDAAAVKAIEATTNHDVKAIEYWLKERFSGVPEVAAASEFIHFACTSEDINNLSHALMLQEARETDAETGRNHQKTDRHGA